MQNKRKKSGPRHARFLPEYGPRLDLGTTMIVVLSCCVVFLWGLIFFYSL